MNIKSRYAPIAHSLALIVATFIGMVHLAYPFGGDQALFVQGGLRMSQGALLYRDFWDVKQPGIYGFYWLAGSLFGFNENGIHTLELAGLVALSLGLMLAFKPHFQQPVLASLIPLFSTGLFYIASGSWHLTQVEALAGLPLFGVLAFTAAATQNAKHRVGFAFLAGVTAGWVILLKLVLAPIVLAFWLFFLAQDLQQRKRISQIALRFVLPISIGTLLPIVITVVYFAWHNALPVFIELNYTWPIQAIAILPKQTLAHLVRNALWLVKWFYQTIFLSGIAVVFLVLRRRVAPLVAGLLIWLVVGTGVVLIQRLSWLEYHFALFFVPLGVLGALGIDFLWARIRHQPKTQQWLTAISLVALFSSPALNGLNKINVWVQHALAVAPQSQRAYQAALSPDYATAMEEIKFIKTERTHTPSLFVFGHPVYYALSGFSQRIASNGWVVEQYLPEQWLQLNAELIAQPPDYIFVTSEYGYPKIIASRAQATGNILNQKYTVLHQSKNGTWYVHKPYG